MNRMVLLVALVTGTFASHEAMAATASKTATSETGSKATASKASKSDKSPKTATSKTQTSHMGLKAIGAAVGFVSPEDADGTFSVGAFADWGMITPEIGLESRLDYWSQSESSFGVEASVSDITLGARGKYYFEVSNSNLRPFAGAGLGLHFLHAEVVIPAQPGFPEMKAEDSSTKLGLDLGGGLAIPINPRADLLTELWYGVVSGANQFSLRVGLSHRLGS
jgi:opacity protein-like surface antigen